MEVVAKHLLVVVETKEMEMGKIKQVVVKSMEMEIIENPMEEKTMEVDKCADLTEKDLPMAKDQARMSPTMVMLKTTMVMAGKIETQKVETSWMHLEKTSPESQERIIP